MALGPFTLISSPAIRNLISDLRKDVKDGLITKKFFQKEVAKLTKKLEKGGKI